jgi:hypothetical protein
MQGCMAPSEIPGISSGEASLFGSVAENLIFTDFCSQYPPDLLAKREVFSDDYNRNPYLYFLGKYNPGFTQAKQEDYYRHVRGEKGMERIPDILVHTPNERAFYEIKPDSPSGRRDGDVKVAELHAIYDFYGLPYKGGRTFRPRDHVVARAPGLEVRLVVTRAPMPDGLILYKLCLKANGILELATLAVLLRLIVREMNKQRKSDRFDPVDLEPVFHGNQQLGDLARILGLGSAAAATAVVTVRWRHFWKAVARRFALRGAAAATLAAADGPLPIGDLAALGLSIWTIIDIVRLSDALWREAAMIARNEI